MPRLLIALAAGWLALMAVAASAQGVDFESRGFRGQIYVGKTYPPRYSGEKSYNEERSSPRRATRSHEARKSKSNDTETAEKAKPTPANEDSEFENSSITTTSPVPASQKAAQSGGSDNENSTITTASVSDDKAGANDEKNVETTDASAKVEAKGEPTAARPTGCSRYFPTVGKTLEVPCE